MDSMIHKWYLSSNVQLRTFVLQQSCFESGGEVILAAMLGPLGAAQLRGPKSYDGVIVVILPY